tara:strand:- start:638 stop:805 length:168 start_codon:yes stop_codon:yes gene_type:complete
MYFILFFIGAIAVRAGLELYGRLTENPPNTYEKLMKDPAFALDDRIQEIRNNHIV